MVVWNRRCVHQNVELDEDSRHTLFLKKKSELTFLGLTHIAML